MTTDSMGHQLISIFSRVLPAGLFMLCAVPGLLPVCHGDISLPRIFSDNMVLQRDTTIRVWGRADAGEVLEISMADQQVKTTCDANGKWSVQLACPPTGGPYELRIRGGEAQVIFKNVMVGEVWLCAGENNMEWPFTEGLINKTDEEKAQLISSIADPNLRLFTVPHAALDQPGEDLAAGSTWQECNSLTVPQFSAVAYFFAKHLRTSEKLADVPIGLISASWAGSSCESWMSRSSLESEPQFAPLLEHWNENPEYRGPLRPGSVFNGMIAPLTPFSVRGVIWYQGESNVQRGHQYATLFRNLIIDWRLRFNRDDLPFYFVQLAPFRYEHDPRLLPELWEAQLKALQVAKTGMVVTTDIGNLQDIHPRNKEEVGRRLALIARSQLYEEIDLLYSGPLFSGVEYKDGKAFVRFDFAKGLRSATDKLQGFTVCGPDNEFVDAQATIDPANGVVQVWADNVPDPCGVRFSWIGTTSGYLLNEAGLPASPFRTDKIDLLSRDRNF